MVEEEGINEKYLNVWRNIFKREGMKKGEKVIMNGGK